MIGAASKRICILDSLAALSEEIAERIDREPGLEVVCKYSQEEKVFQYSAAFKPDLLIIDPLACRKSPTDTIKRYQNLFPAIKIMVFYTVIDTAMRLELDKLKVDKLIEKGIDSSRLVQEIKTVLK